MHASSSFLPPIQRSLFLSGCEGNLLIFFSCTHDSVSDDDVWGTCTKCTLVFISHSFE